MKGLSVRIVFIICIIAICAGCANITPLSGGKKDTIPPKLLSVTPSDSLYNSRFHKLVLRFDEYVTVADAAAQVQISPLLGVPLTVLGTYKHVTITIPDTLLQDNTTYRITFGNSIKDLHEGNPVKPYTYVFSTGTYFDSLKIAGKVYNASTGLPDTSAVILLYDAVQPDSSIVRKKPSYVARVDISGNFFIDGLPGRDFKMYALRDKNNNLIYDGGGNGEWIGFTDHIVHPVPDSITHIIFQLFPEGKDTTANGSGSSAAKFAQHTEKSKSSSKEGFTYTAAIDTSDVKKRTVDISRPLTVTFNKLPVTIHKEKFFLSYDSAGVAVETALTITADTGNKEMLKLQPAAWKENTVYTLRLIKGFVKDSAGTDAMPSRYTFHTKRDEDYGKLTIHLPGKYSSADYVLQVTTEKDKDARDTIYQKVITDTIVYLNHLSPATYTFRVIADKNHNGMWDSGDLFAKKQPEMVIPYSTSIVLKAGWENVIDFEEQKKAVPDKAKASSR